MTVHDAGMGVHAGLEYASWDLFLPDIEDQTHFRGRSKSGHADSETGGHAHSEMTGHLSEMGGHAGLKYAPSRGFTGALPLENLG